MIDTTYQLPDDNQPLEFYMQEFGRLDKAAIGYDRSLGRLRWLQGSLLLLARKRVNRRGEWGDLLASFAIKPKTAYLLRRIAEAIPEDRSHVLGYQEMLAEVFPSYASRNGGLNVDVKHEEFADTDPLDGERAKATDTTTKHITIDKIRATLETYSNGLQRLTASSLIPSKINPRELPTVYGEVIRLAEQISRDALRVKATIEQATKNPTGDNPSQSKNKRRKAA